MRTYFLVFFISAANLLASAQNLQSRNARSMALSQAMIAVPDISSGASNAGALSAHSRSGIELNYQNRYMLPELGTQSLYLSLKLGKGILSPQLGYFGSAAYNQTRLSLAYGHKLAEWFFAGVNLIGTNQTIQATGETTFGAAADIGLFAKLASGFQCGLQISSPGSEIVNSENVLSQKFGLGLGAAYKKAENFLLTAQLCWQDNQELVLAGGAEVFPLKYLALRAGFKLPSSASYSFGIGLYQNTWKMNLGFEQHQVLGLSASISLLINFTKNGG